MIMLLYVFLIFLPATALALCSGDGAYVFFNIIDRNNDSYVEPKEGYDFISNADLDGDGVVSVDEIEIIIPVLAPELAGSAKELVSFSDVDGDGKISINDVVEGYDQYDEDGDGFISVDEFQKYIDVVCETK